MQANDLFLHPIRLRIVQAMLGSEGLTTTDLREALPDVPIATLYRQVGTLVEGGVLTVVNERRVRGATERAYVLKLENAQLDPTALREMGAEDHRQAFLAFIAGLLRDFDSYVEAGDVDYGRDGVGYRSTALWLSDEEFVEFANGFANAVIPFLDNEPAPGRRRRVFTTAVMPVAEPSEPDA